MTKQEWSDIISRGGGWLIDVFFLAAASTSSIPEYLEALPRYKEGDTQEKAEIWGTVLLMVLFDCGEEAYREVSQVFRREVDIDIQACTAAFIHDIRDRAESSLTN